MTLQNKKKKKKTRKVKNNLQRFSGKGSRQRSSITLFVFGTLLVTLLVTFSHASVTFFCQTPLAGLLWGRVSFGRLFSHFFRTIRLLRCPEGRSFKKQQSRLKFQSRLKLQVTEVLRAKGTLISEPRFSTPREMRFFPTRERENGLFKEHPLTKAVFPFSRGKNRISQGVENRGSLISVPLALRVTCSILTFRFAHRRGLGGWLA